ncbi:MAG: ribonuclease P protein component [Planctomycetes bacterium]|nr:ribonuclease P protein component [Planctomycetota bacterium]
MQTDQRFQRRDRLRLTSEFARVYAARRRAGNDILLVYVADNRLGWSRLGLSVSKRVGNAVYRSRVRRLIREAFRKSRAELPVGIDIICVAKPRILQAAAEITPLLRKFAAAAQARTSREDGRRPARE